MNLLIFKEEELDGKILGVSGRRAKHLLDILKIREGKSIRLGMVNGPVGTGEVIHCTKKEVQLRVNLAEKPIPDIHVELILALPRPIMLQRILKQATVLGVRHFYLVRSRRVEKSFFQSPVLEPEKMESLLIEGMEQGMDTHLPAVSVHHWFKPFAEEVLPTLEGRKIIAHPQAEDSLPGLNFSFSEQKRVCLAIGPEGGWNDFELDMFAAQGFASFTMGKRILHVDTAVVALLSQLQLLFDLEEYRI